MPNAAVPRNMPPSSLLSRKTSMRSMPMPWVAVATISPAAAAAGFEKKAAFD